MTVTATTTTTTTTSKKGDHESTNIIEREAIDEFITARITLEEDRVHPSTKAAAVSALTTAEAEHSLTENGRIGIPKRQV